MKNTNLIQVISIFILLVLVSCSTKPSESTAREDLSKRLKKQFEGKVELIEFEKVNAVDRQFLGQKMYIIQYDAKLRALEQCLVYSVTQSPILVEKGNEVEFTNEMTYVKTENGWVKAKKSMFE